MEHGVEARVFPRVLYLNIILRKFSMLTEWQQDQEPLETKFRWAKRFNSGSREKRTHQQAIASSKPEEVVATHSA